MPARFAAIQTRVSNVVKQVPTAVVNRCCSQDCPQATCRHDNEVEPPTLFRSGRTGFSGTELTFARQVANSSGRALPDHTAQTMSAQFAHDFSRVRVHDDSVAARAAASVGADAYSIGHHVVFGANQYQPQTRSGQRLLAHELTHVVQADCGTGATKAVSSESDASEREAVQTAERVTDHSASHAKVAQAGSAWLHRQPQPAGDESAQHDRQRIPAEKWSETLEARYRANGDHQRAAAIRECREFGAGACDIVLTQSEMYALYQLSQSAQGDEGKVRDGLTTAVPTLALLGPLPGLGGIGTGAGVAAGGTATAAGASAGAVAATGVGALLLMCVAAGYTLWKLTKFQQELTRLGFIILDDPLAICIKGCHQASPARLRDFRHHFPDGTFDPIGSSKWRRYFDELPVPGRPTQTEPRPRVEPRPLPGDPDVDEERRHGCHGYATFQRGGNSCHDRFATSVSGVPREWMLVTPGGVMESFDARGQDRHTLYEMKTGYGWLQNPNLTSAQQRFRDATRERWITQGTRQMAVADRCGYDLIWVFTSEAARRYADGIVPARTRTLVFNCNEDGERGR